MSLAADTTRMGNRTPVTEVGAPPKSTARQEVLWTECSTCGGLIRRGTRQCPHCGTRTRHDRRLIRPALAIGFLVAVTIAVRRWIGRRLDGET